MADSDTQPSPLPPWLDSDIAYAYRQVVDNLPAASRQPPRKGELFDNQHLAYKRLEDWAFVSGFAMVRGRKSGRDTIDARCSHWGSNSDKDHRRLSDDERKRKAPRLTHLGCAWSVRGGRSVNGEWELRGIVDEHCHAPAANPFEYTTNKYRFSGRDTVLPRRPTARGAASRRSRGAGSTSTSHVGSRPAGSQTPIMAPAVILITGANSAVGLAACKTLLSASEGFHIIMACRSYQKAQQAKSEIEAGGIQGSLSLLQLDVTNEKSIAEAEAYVRQEFGRLDVLVNNAASGSLDPDIGTRLKVCLDTNVVGPALVSAAFRPLLLESHNPYSIYLGSGPGAMLRNAREKPLNQDMRSGDAYMVSKAALSMLAVLEHRDHGAEGIKVFVLSPGFESPNLHRTVEGTESVWGQAQDPTVPAKTLLDIIQGRRDADVGCLVHENGFYSW